MLPFVGPTSLTHWGAPHPRYGGRPFNRRRCLAANDLMAAIAGARELPYAGVRAQACVCQGYNTIVVFALIGGRSSLNADHCSLSQI